MRVEFLRKANLIFYIDSLDSTLILHADTQQIDDNGIHESNDKRHVVNYSQAHTHYTLETPNGILAS